MKFEITTIELDGHISSVHVTDNLLEYFVELYCIDPEDDEGIDSIDQMIQPNGNHDRWTFQDDNGQYLVRKID